MLFWYNMAKLSFFVVGQNMVFWLVQMVKVIFFVRAKHGHLVQMVKVTFFILVQMVEVIVFAIKQVMVFWYKWLK